MASEQESALQHKCPLSESLWGNYIAKELLIHQTDFETSAPGHSVLSFDHYKSLGEARKKRNMIRRITKHRPG